MLELRRFPPLDDSEDVGSNELTSDHLNSEESPWERHPYVFDAQLGPWGTALIECFLFLSSPRLRFRSTIPSQ